MRLKEYETVMGLVRSLNACQFLYKTEL